MSIIDRPMRKPQLEVREQAALEDILRRGEVLRLAMCGEGWPYLVPLYYAYAGGKIYLHTGRQGLKMDLLRANPRVCFEVTVDVEVVPGAEPCRFSSRYQSVVGFGQAVEVEEEGERRQGLLAIVERYAGPGPHQLAEEPLARTCLVRVDIERMTGKRRLS